MSQIERDIAEMQKCMVAFEQLYSESEAGSSKEASSNRVRLGMRRWISRGIEITNASETVKRPKTSVNKKVVSNGK